MNPLCYALVAISVFQIEKEKMVGADDYQKAWF